MWSRAPCACWDLSSWYVRCLPPLLPFPCPSPPLTLLQNLWDCGGQDAFLDNYLSAQRDTIFSNVAVLIYVFDIMTEDWEQDMKYFEENLQALRENSPEAGVWVLINKMDLIDKEDPKRVKYNERKSEIKKLNETISEGVESVGTCRCFPTSIWDESLYRVSTRTRTRTSEHAASVLG